MSKKRLYEIAKELGKESKEVVTRAKELGFDVKSHASSVDTDVAEKLIKSFAAKKETVEKKVAEVAAKTTAVAEKREAAPVKKEGATETKSVMPAAKPKSRNFKANEKRVQKNRLNVGNNKTIVQNVIARTISVMVTTEINDHKSEMNNEIKVLSVAITDQIKDVVHNPKWHQKLISKRVQRH